MARRTTTQTSKGGDDTYGQAAGAIGGLAIVFGILAAIKDKLGLGWPAAVLLTAGALLFLGYLAWRIRAVVKHLLAGEPKSAKTRKEATATAADGIKVSAQKAAASTASTPTDSARAAAEAVNATEANGASEGVVVEAAVQAHPELTAALTTAGAIKQGEVIRADEVTVERVRTGRRYDFRVPKGRTYADVEKKLGIIAGYFGVTRLHTKLERSRDNERSARLLVLDAPPFTSAFAPPTREEIKTFCGVPIGHDVIGDLAGVPTFDKASLLVGGMTQMGKTTLINGLITCLLIAYDGEFDLYLLDGKHCGLTRFEKIAVRYEASDNPAVMLSMLDELNKRVAGRYAKLQDAIRNRKPLPKFRPVFFIVDEAADFFADDGTQDGKELARKVAEGARSLVAKALESGIATVMLTQRPAQNAIPVMVRDQFLYRMCLYVASEGTAKVALGDSYFDTVAPINPVLLDSNIKGQGVLFAHGVSTLIRGFNFSDEFIWDVVDEVEDRQQKKLEAAPESPLKQAIDLMQSKDLEFIRSVDLGPSLGTTDPRPGELGKQLSKLLGMGSGKDSEGVRGYWLDDLIAALKSRS